MFGCAAIGRGASPALVAVLLFVSGASRSMHFTALGTLPFADVEPRGDEHGEPDLQRVVSGGASRSG